MVQIDATYDGTLRCSAVHTPSDSRLTTDAPKDNEGLGASFSPTDLVATALVTCALTTMAILARREGIPFERAHASIEKHMVADPRRRIGRLPMRITLPADTAVEHREFLERAARTCPVASSLRADLDATITFVYADS